MSNKIVITIDGGKWYEQKVHANYSLKASDGTTTAGNVGLIYQDLKIPQSGWKQFPSDDIPKMFNYGHIYHHIIESPQFSRTDHVQLSECDSEAEDDSLDVGTEKPMRKGMVFFKSGHVQSMMNCVNEDNFYLCKCMSSFTPKTTYNVCVSLSKDSGFVKGASCNCKASALGRCNHVAALLFAILDWTKKRTSDQPACTSVLCEWNKGRKEKAPKAFHVATYDSVGATETKRRKKEPHETVKFDPRPTNLRSAPSTERINNFLMSMQSSLNGEKSM